MAIRKPIPFDKLIDALLDENTPFSPRFLHRLSDLEPAYASILSQNWPKISTRRREALLEDMEESHIVDDLLSFEEVARLAGEWLAEHLAPSRKPREPADVHR